MFILEWKVKEFFLEHAAKQLVKKMNMEVTSPDCQLYHRLEFGSRFFHLRRWDTEDEKSHFVDVRHAIR